MDWWILGGLIASVHTTSLRLQHPKHPIHRQMRKEPFSELEWMIRIKPLQIPLPICIRRTINTPEGRNILPERTGPLKRGKNPTIFHLGFGLFNHSSTSYNSDLRYWSCHSLQDSKWYVCHLPISDKNGSSISSRNASSLPSRLCVMDPFGTAHWVSERLVCLLTTSYSKNLQEGAGRGSNWSCWEEKRIKRHVFFMWR